MQVSIKFDLAYNCHKYKSFSEAILLLFAVLKGLIVGRLTFFRDFNSIWLQ